MIYSPSFYKMNEYMTFIMYWLMCFLPIIFLKIGIVHYKKMQPAQDSMFFTEAIGLPLTFLQPFIFFHALFHQDWLGFALTVWWGFGFLMIVFLVLGSKVLKKKIKWGNSAPYISWLCKIYYIVYVALGFLWNMPELIFVLSAWIASDQIEKSFASLDADRTRRTFHDFWFIRLSYPAFLLLPLFYSEKFSLIFQIYGVVLLIIWGLGIYYVKRIGWFMKLPQDPSLLRNMMYFKKDS